MTWNHRVVRYPGGMFGIHEVFYDNHEPWGCTEQPVGPVGDTLVELLEELTRMAACIEQPTLDYEKIGGKS
jgi:hypothetical protein